MTDKQLSNRLWFIAGINALAIGIGLIATASTVAPVPFLGLIATLMGAICLGFVKYGELK